MKSKILSVVITFLLLLSSLPLCVTADAGVTVCDETELIAALEIGGKITIGATIILSDSVSVTKDTFIDLNGNTIQLQYPATADCTFSVSGATLTVNTQSGELRYNGKGSLFKITGQSERATKIELYGGTYIADSGYDFEQGDFTFPASLFAVSYNETDIKPQITLDGGNFTCSAYDTEISAPTSKGNLVFGDKSCLTIYSGNFGTLPTEYLSKNSICFEEWGSFTVIYDAPLFSDDFKTILNDNNQLVLKRFMPDSTEDVEQMINALYETISVSGEFWFDFYTNSYDPENHTLCVTLAGVKPESHKLQVVFDYDPQIKNYIDAVIEELPSGEVFEDFTAPYCYKVSDLELINYWMTCSEDVDNINNLINYSDEFKRQIGYKNFKISTGYGDGDMFYTFAGGHANFLYNNTVYAAKEMEVQADHIIYVPDETADNDMVTAAQNRIDSYIGQGKVVLSYAGTVAEVNGESYVDGITPEDICVTTTINGSEYFIAIIRDSKKAVVPTYKNIDIVSDIEVSSDNSSIPLDTILEVDKLTAGDEYDRIIGILDAKENETFDIKLHSGNSNGYITQLENGSFEVKVPIPENLEGTSLSAYYVNSDNSITEYTVTETDGYACFETDHFSIYTLAPSKSTHTHTYDNEYDLICNSCGFILEGDPSGDGIIGSQDTVWLKKIILNVVSNKTCDVNHDGKTDILDLIRLKKIIAMQ